MLTEFKETGGELLDITIESEMKRSYLDYAMSVIVSRAIPDVRDGLKPVHRRILYSMHESGYDWNKPYRKSARIVGDVMGKYHPHGDSAIYDSLVRMAQDFSLRLTLIDGQGNFGSMDGDSAAAMRYTESRLNQASASMLEDIDKNTVLFQDNYDGSEREPVVLPARFPNILINGSSGIAVGMATNILPHNLGEIIDACCLYIDNAEATDEEFLAIVKGPDFPTGGIILGMSGARASLLTGRGSIVVRGKSEIIDITEKKQAIIISEIPYQVNKAKMIERIAELVREKKIEGISDLRDESDRSGVRVVVEIKRDAFAEVVLNQLYTYTPLQTSYGVNMLMLDHGRPQMMNLRKVIAAFVNFREEVITKRTKFLLAKVRDRAHILIGLMIAVANIDEIIALIKASADPQLAKQQLMKRNWSAGDIQPLIDLVAEKGNIVIDGKCYLTEEQAKAILEMRLQRLTGLESSKITNELKDLSGDIKGFLEILGSRTVLMELLKSELIEMREKFATPRKTHIEMSEFEHDIEDLIPREEMVVTVTMAGYIKRVPLSTYRAQRRGGKGRSGVSIRNEDATINIFIASTHSSVLFFSTKGKVYRLKVYKLPLGGTQSKGRALINIFPLAEGEAINQVMSLPEDEALWDSKNIVFATASGNIRRNSLDDFKSIHSNGKIAMKLDEGDELIGINICEDSDHVFLAAKSGKCVRFEVAENLRVFKSRDSDGVRGMKLASGDRVISMTILKAEEQDSSYRDEFLKISLEARTKLANCEEVDVAGLVKELDLKLIDAEKISRMASEEQFILTVTENGYGKITSSYEYRTTSRGGSGVVNIITSARNGPVVSSALITRANQVMLLSNQGTVIRCRASDIRIIGRSTQGVTLFRMDDKNEKLVSASIITQEEISEEGAGEGSEEALVDDDNAE